jgi:LmbE family N-acetylglucosaminyl deacetylase
MSGTPIAAPHTEGRVYGADWSIGNVAKLLRSNAARGAWRSSGTTGGLTAKLNRNYVRTVSAHHLSTNVTVIFMRLEAENCRYASLCFASADDYLPWNGDTAEQWLRALFDRERPQVLPCTGETGNPSVRQFTLAKY